MVSSCLWTDIDSRLGEMFMTIPEKTFAGLPFMTVTDLLQLPLVREKNIFSQFSDNDSMKYLPDLQFDIYLNIQNYFKLSDKTINCLLTCLMQFELVILMLK